MSRLSRTCTSVGLLVLCAVACEPVPRGDLIEGRTVAGRGLGGGLPMVCTVYAVVAGNTLTAVCSGRHVKVRLHCIDSRKIERAAVHDPPGLYLSPQEFSRSVVRVSVKGAHWAHGLIPTVGRGCSRFVRPAGWSDRAWQEASGAGSQFTRWIPSLALGPGILPGGRYKKVAQARMGFG